MLPFPGRDIFLERSELNRPANALRALATILGVALIETAFFWAIDGAFVASTLVTQALAMIAGIALVSQLIVRRRNFQARWGARAFSLAFRTCAIPGLTLILVGLGHFAWIEGARVVPRAIALPLMGYLLISGIALWARALIVFGVDNVSMLYVYFPAESRLVDAQIYGILRHPFYSAVQRIAFALALMNGSAFALFAGVMTPLAMWLWVRSVEEVELIERFGDRYRDYRARVPAFFNFDPRAWVTLWKFLLTGR